MRPFLTTQEFIDRAIIVHSNFYSYGQTKYIKSSLKVIITCPIHGDFAQIAFQHLQGRGCPVCGGSGKRSNISFKQDSNKVHNFKYNYDKTIYEGIKKPVIITCNEHGDFLQRPDLHLRGQGCKQCFIKRRSRKHEIFIKEASAIHNNFYDYVKTIYINSYTKIIITCPTHGDFLQLPYSHLRKQGCAKCQHDSVRGTLENFLEKAKETHNNRYLYHKVEYISIDTKIIITCRNHGDFLQVPYNHIKGQGCPICAKIKQARLKSSKNEKYCAELLKKNYVNYKIFTNDWNVLKQKSRYGNDLEIDIIIKDKDKDLLYIEWNGTWCHAQENHKINDKIKKDALGDKLLVIEDSGKYDETFVENVVETIIKPYLNKILESS